MGTGTPILSGPHPHGPHALSDSDSTLILNDLVLSELPTLPSTLPSSSSSYFPSTSTSALSVDDMRDRNDAISHLENLVPGGSIVHQITDKTIENNNVGNEGDSDSEKDDEGGSIAINTNGLNCSSLSHTVAAVPVEEETDNSNFISNSNSNSSFNSNLDSNIENIENRNPMPHPLSLPLPLPLNDSLRTHSPTHALIPLESMTDISINEINTSIQSTHPLSRKRKILK